jgi:hypothetical protein
VHITVGETPFVSLLITPLDSLPLSESRRLLITAMARGKQTEAEFSEDWSELRRIGRPPLRMEPVQATIRFRNASPAEVRPLDLYGVPREQFVEIGEDGAIRIDGRYRTWWYQVLR